MGKSYRNQTHTEQDLVSHQIQGLPQTLIFYIHKAVPGIVIPIVTPKRWEKTQELKEIVENVHNILAEMFREAQKRPEYNAAEQEKLHRKIARWEEQHVRNLELFEEKCRPTLEIFERDALEDDIKKYKKLFGKVEKCLLDAVAINSAAIVPKLKMGQLGNIQVLQ